MKPSKATLNKVWISIIIILVLGLTGLLSSSSFREIQGSSIIVIAIERLSFNSFSCSDDKSTASSGLSALCKEAIRFTHAYTTSSQPSAALGSLLTGQYPVRHKLHKGSDRLDVNLQTLPSIAQKQKYRTSFFGGSPNITRKAGLYRGFDVYDDLSFLNYRNYTVPLKTQLENAFTWIKSDIQPFLTVVHSAELESLSQTETETSTFEKLDENLSIFFENLKRSGDWDKNYIVVLGLNGTSDLSRPQETTFSNLHSENTNIIAFLKPPRQKGDEGIYWKVDTSLNLADLGQSLMKTVDPGFLSLVDTTFPIRDFSTLWRTASSSESLLAPRRLLIESVNPWKKENEVRFATHYKNLFYVENIHDELYNTLTDGLETNDISSTATSAQNDFMNENRKIFGELRKNRNLKMWRTYKSNWQDLADLNRRYWMEINSRNLILEEEIERFRQSKIAQPLTGLALITANVKLKNELAKITQTNPANVLEKDRDLYLQILRLHSLNLALENIWSIWKPDALWTQSNLIVEYQ